MYQYKKFFLILLPIILLFAFNNCGEGFKAKSYSQALTEEEFSELTQECTDCAEVPPAVAPAPIPAPVPAPAPSSNRSPQGSDLISVIDFEDSKPGSAAEHPYLKVSGNAPQIVTAENGVTPRSGKYMMKTYLNRKTSVTNYRTEVSLNTPSGFTKGKEYWMFVSVYLPSNWNTNYENKYSNGMIWQFHGRPYTNPTEYRSIQPISVMHTPDGWQVRNHYYPTKTVNAKKGLGSLVGFSKIAPYKLGQWNDFVLNFQFSGNISPDDTNGFIKVWVNGKKLVDIKGQNYFGEEEHGPYFKMGIYNWGWKYADKWVGPDSRVLYHDEVRVGGANSSYSDVSPPE